MVKIFLLDSRPNKTKERYDIDFCIQLTDVSKFNGPKVANNALTVLKAPNFYFIGLASVVPETAQVC